VAELLVGPTTERANFGLNGRRLSRFLAARASRAMSRSICGYSNRPMRLIVGCALGTLEWLPGKPSPLSEVCWPEALIGPMPVI